MRTEFAQKEYISSRTWKTLCDKFYDEFTQDDLGVCYRRHVPVFVRHNNRNVYARVYLSVDCRYMVTDFYRLTRDGFPVRIYLDYVSD